MPDPVYAHVLLFECPECTQPIAVCNLNQERNLEAVDAQEIDIVCFECNSPAVVLAATAKRHLVQRWTGPRVAAAMAGK